MKEKYLVRRAVAVLALLLIAANVLAANDLRIWRMLVGFVVDVYSSVFGF